MRDAWPAPSVAVRRVPCAACLALSVAVALMAGCRLPWLDKQPAGPAAVLRAADAALPEIALEGLGEYPGPRLFDYMNGAAEAYFRHRFVNLASADTRLGKTDARLELFLLKSPQDARAVFDDHDDGKGKKLPVGVASSLWEAREMEAIFCRGPYFCRLIIYGASPEAHKLLHALARAVDSAIAPAP